LRAAAKISATDFFLSAINSPLCRLKFPVMGTFGGRSAPHRLRWRNRECNFANGPLAL
jgi:hypothetical protein